MNTGFSPTADGGASGPDAVGRLRQLLRAPRPADPDWQDEAGRMVALTAVRFLSDEPVAALRDWALISLAAVLGVKSAKKRLPNTARWAKDSPPDLSALSELDERRAALGTLAKLKKPWVAEYAARCVQDEAIGIDLVPTLVGWVVSSSSDRAVLLGVAVPRVLADLSDAARLRFVAKELGKLPASGDPVSADALSKALEELSAAVAAAVSRLDARGDTATSGPLIAATLGVLQQTWRQSPGVLLHAATQRAFQRLRMALPRTQKAIPSEVRNASVATVSVLVELVKLGGRDCVPHVRQMLPALAATYPGFLDCLRTEAGQAPLLQGILSGEDSKADHSPDADVQDVFAGLLPAWDAYVAELNDEEPVRPIGAMLQRAAAAVGIGRVGEPGTVVPYVPSDHHLDEVGGSPPSLVRVLSPGVSVRRDSGAERVLIRALVAAVQ